MRTGAAYCQSPGPGIEDRLDYAIELFCRARRIIDAGVDDPAEQETVSHERVRVLLNEGTAFARRRRGDLESNHERACELLREALRSTSLDSEPRVWAMVSTNLGMSLATRAKRRDEEDPARALEISEAIKLLRGALRWRSFERNPLDWSYTQTGLGLAYGARGGGDLPSNARKAIEHYRAAVRGLQAAGAAELEAQAWHNIGSEMLVLLRLDGTDEGDCETLASQAASAFRQSLALRPMNVDPVGAGSAYSALASVLELAGDVTGAIDARREALNGLMPDTAPQAARDEARRLAELAKRAGDWEGAAHAYEIAVEASIAALESRADSLGRFDELGQGLTVFRWAAEALLRTGQSRRAVEVLEQGRARELAAWLHRNASTADLHERDPPLHEKLLALEKQLKRHEQDRRAGLPVELQTAAEAQEGYRQTLAEIRLLPGFERFRLPETYDDIAAAIPEGEALVYLFSAPEGTAALVVTRAADPEVVEAPQLASGRLIRVLIRPDAESGDLVGYLPAQASGSAGLDREIEDLAELLGPTLLQPLARRIERSGAHTVCIVAAGLLGLLPLHALTWSDGSERSCLLEHFSVVMAPSAMARRTCRQRAAERCGRGTVLAVGNPLPSCKPLRWAEQEAMNVAHTFSSASTTTLVGVDATADAVIDALRDAWIAHLACHGSAAMSAQALDNALYLAGGEPVTGADLLGLAPLQARLVVASACETAIIPGYETVDEALSLGTVLIGAGAAGAIASLWSVDDFATALLMSRFYDEMAAGATPAHALRIAALWLRDLPRADAEAYADTRPALRAKAERAGGLGIGEQEQPFASTRLWAPFVLSGA